MSEENAPVVTTSANLRTDGKREIDSQRNVKALVNEASSTSLSMESITDGKSERGIPAVKFLEDISAFADSFTPTASAELLIGAFSDLFSKFKVYEQNLSQKSKFSIRYIWIFLQLNVISATETTHVVVPYGFILYQLPYVVQGLTFQEKIPEIEKSLSLVNHLKKKKEDGESVITRYNLADMIHTKAELDCSVGIVNLWLGANVMLEYTYDEAIELLSSKLESAKKEFGEVSGCLHVLCGMISADHFAYEMMLFLLSCLSCTIK